MRQLFVLRTHLEYTLKLVDHQRLELMTIAEGHPFVTIGASQVRTDISISHFIRILIIGASSRFHLSKDSEFVRHSPTVGMHMDYTVEFSLCFSIIMTSARSFEPYQKSR